MATKKTLTYTTREAATLLSCCMKTVRDYITSGKLRAARRGRGHYLIYEKDIRAFLGMGSDDALTWSVGDEG